MTPIPWTYVRAELRREPLAFMGLSAGLFGAVSILATCWAVPRLPESVLTLLSLSLAVEGLPALVLVNTLLAVWFVAYFVGAVVVIRAIAAPRAENGLDLLLVKPVPPEVFVWSRILPAFGLCAAVGLGLSLTQVIGMWGLFDDQLSAAGALGAGLTTVAVAIAQLGALTALTARSTELAGALGLAIAVFMAVLTPTSVFIYRPDLFPVDGLGRALFVAPTSLILHSELIAWAWPIVMLVGVGVGALGLAWAARRVVVG
ncbi:hypothetical protein L6R49_02385 [Myxococcota bacterium]|nr:hypothetical protein [Myxococcota bacterium]